MEFNDLSIVIPVGPGDWAWQGLLDELAILQTAPEIILSACQSLPDGVSLPMNVRWISGEQGRAVQLNAGANAARGGIVWFLHADSRFAANTLESLGHFLHSEANGIGYFRLIFAEDGPVMTRINAWAANLRSRLLHLPFGDQGFILRQCLFKQLNGFDPSVKLGEDLDFVVRARAAGVTLQALSGFLITSVRRYQQHGWLVTTVRHIRLTWQLARQASLRLENRL
jgi:rSAM/selenodomain-associated transferase 2